MENPIDIFKKNDNFLILPHIRPDGDAVGSTIALWRALIKIGKTAYILPEEGEFPSKFSMLDGNRALSPEDFLPECVIAVDCADRNMLGDRGEKYKKIDLNIDHHPTNTLYGEVNSVNPGAAAAGEIIYSVVSSLTSIDEDIARCIYVAIASDTGCFAFSNVTPKTFRMAAELISITGPMHNINHKLFQMMTRNQFALESKIIKDISFYEDGKIAIATITEEMLEDTGTTCEDASIFSQLPRRIEGVIVSATLKEDGKYTRLSLRSNDIVDVSEICAKLGGGGHKCAAGATLEMSPAEAKEKIKDEMIFALNQAK